MSAVWAPYVQVTAHAYVCPRCCIKNGQKLLYTFLRVQLRKGKPMHSGKMRKTGMCNGVIKKRKNKDDKSCKTG
ncbi:hypothetical protein POVWA2_020900 [Plasmodium ovale wallikeri]|uniref:Uncharacterized protein n=1 Tax=Plasmodium ovale wallikeri TaxID=864142 RepID=A0A1A8YR91_PLAOA|nr:hypothetical protein POVWA1_020690 [Plasmodium ovale wallikeri]SBT34629.1 hypothetical protein POVWA2_020900 [Plasmodium ovale wallikeri]